MKLAALVVRRWSCVARRALSAAAAGNFGDAFWNPIDGVKQSEGYDDRLAAIVDAELSYRIDWRVIGRCSLFCNTSFIPAVISPIRSFRALYADPECLSCLVGVGS